MVYKFATAAMLAEPLMLVAGFFAFFAASIAYIHLDFSISKSSASYQARVQREEVGCKLLDILLCCTCCSVLEILT